MRRILFIRPESQGSEPFDDLLQPNHNQWDMCVATGAKAVQDQLVKGPWDIVIADLETESGRSQLAVVRAAFPEIVRFGLVNQRRPSPSLVSVVHQFLVRPLEFAELEVAVERACRLKELLHGELMSKTVGELGSLPTAPTVYLKLIETLNKPESSIDQIAEIVETDMTISAKVLQLVNSAIFRTNREIATVKMATTYLGLNIIKNLVLSTEVMSVFSRAQKIPGFSIEELQAHARLTASIAGIMYLSNEARDAAIVASLLHDIGKLVLAWKMPERFARLLALSREQNRPLYQIEEELCGITHAEIGAYLLGLWGLPIPITEAIAFHHTPARMPHHHFDALGAVYVANVLAHEVDGSLRQGHELWDSRLLKSLDVSHKVPVWSVLAQQIGSPQLETVSHR
jgi:HD-like signal output (HDOD) protein